ncbi:probable galacturonosyltransferase 7 isoform X2 [Oryza glaberrima]|uniref:probable galacturonosyltransferase 7 isoform X2 n=1 Tax=Oryza glaberrima TaxID=4538 RepID=UPI00224C26E3|nr:probable galacturonosyltransferase 7 isoform X2 [Oryza glaberrima]
MKATLLPPPPPAKRRRGPRVAVLALFLCSLLVPLAFLFDRSQSGYVTTDERRRQEVVLPEFHHVEKADGDGTVNGLNQDAPKKTPKVNSGGLQKHKQTDRHTSRISTKPKVLPSPKVDPSEAVKESTQGTREVSKVRKRLDKGTNTDEVENEKACQLEFGSYCLWSREHKVVMKDSIVKRLKDQLFVARSYYPSIAKLEGQEELTVLMKQNIQDHERVLSVSTVDADLPSFINKKMEQMEQTIARAKSCTVDCRNVDRKLRQILDMTEDEAHFHMKQSAFLYNLGAQTLPKSHHCLSMRHYVILSKNILAASVVINSTVNSSKDPKKIIFHILTDAQNFYAMKYWFDKKSYREAAVHVVNYEDIIKEKLTKFNVRHLYLSEEFRVLVRSTEQPAGKTRMEYLSLFSHSHFFIPEIFKDLNKVVVLDDDVVVQRDLSFLWSLDMGDKVNGAIEFCGLRLGQVRNLLGSTTVDTKSCAWMSGINVINLDKWRKHKVTENYLLLLKKFLTKDETSLRAAAFPLSLLSFQHLIYPLDERLILSGLGYDYAIDEDVARSSAALHYNGNMKPWLELGIPSYRRYWKRFLTRDDKFMDECNIIP